MKNPFDTNSLKGLIPEEDLKKLSASVKTKTFKKGEIIQHKGESVKNAYFVKSGLLRSYVIDGKGKEHIFMFGPEGWVVTDIASTKIDEPMLLTIDAIEDSEVEVFNARDLDNVIELMAMQNSDHVVHEINRLLRRISTLQKRIIMLMSFTAYERYEEFQSMYPDLVQRVPQKMIASFLGITPESLSKIKSQHLRKK